MNILQRIYKYVGHKTLNKMTFLLVIMSVITLVKAGHKCQSSVDVLVKWTVDCSRLNLSSAPPPVYFHPVVLLNMSHNMFVQLIESQFEHWSDISYLDLSFNMITNVDKDSFKGMSNLTQLNLSKNRIVTLSLNITNHIPKLRILNLSSNELKIIMSETFQPVPLLLKLFLENNSDLGKSLDNYISLNISLVQGLISLNLANTSISDIPLEFLNNANHLISLNIAQNPIKNIPELPHSLRSLNISGTVIETLPQGLFQKCDLLQKLSLERMSQLKDIKSNALSGLNNLEELYIKECPKLSFISMDAFGESTPKLKKVVISHCALVTLPKTFKQLFNKAEYLDLQNNPWICDGRISWIMNSNILPNLTENLRCEKPPTIRGMLMTDYFKPRALHPHYTLIRAGVVLVIVAVLVASVVAMVRHTSKQKVKTYQQLQGIRLQDFPMSS